MTIQDKIFDAALKLFVRDGFATNTTSITKEAGVSTGILFHYYPTKNDLIVAIYSECYREYLDGGTKLIRAALDNPDTEYYIQTHRQAYWEGIHWCLNNWDKFQYINLFEGSKYVNKFNLDSNPDFQEVSAGIMDVLQAGVDRGILVDLPPELILSNFYAITNSIVRFLHDHPQFQQDDQFMERAWLIYWHTSAR